MKVSDIPHLANMMRQEGIARLKIEGVEIDLVPMWHPPVHLPPEEETDPSTPSAKHLAAKDEDIDFWSSDT